MESVLQQIAVVVDDIRFLMNSKHPVHPEQFSAEGMKLAILNQKLGEIKTDLKRRQLIAEKTKYDEAVGQKMSATAANAYVRAETINERALFDLAETQHKDNKGVMDMLRTHTSAIKEDK